MQTPPFDLMGKRVLVVGLGRSGMAAARLCASKDAQVTVNDAKDTAELRAQLSLLPATVKCVLGSHPAELFAAQDAIVLSPGVPPMAAIDHARAKGAFVTGELERSGIVAREIAISRLFI